MPAIPSHSTATTEDNPGGNTVMTNATTAADYRAVCAWRDPDGDPELRESYKFPHHTRPGGPASLPLVRNGLGRLPQSDVPVSDHEGVRRHLQRHLEDDQGRSRGEDPMADVERRYTPYPVEIRSGDELRRIGGYASVFNKESRNLGGFVEVVDPIAFNKSRGDGWPDVIARYNHDSNMLLGTTAARTLQLEIDEYGLAYIVAPPQSRGDIFELVERGDVRHSSFAFRVPRGGDEWTTSDQGYPLRRLVAAQLVDVSPVVEPAYADTSAGLRSLAEYVQAPLEEVRSLAEANELRKFFVRTDRKTGKPAKPKTYGPAALMEILGKEQDPWA